MDFARDLKGQRKEKGECHYYRDLEKPVYQLHTTLLNARGLASRGETKYLSAMYSREIGPARVPEIYVGQSQRTYVEKDLHECMMHA